ncbi:zinc finger protein Eos-like isoform X2 [Eucyclogobius newberryi]|uniref:zinc finger protein Eos-like isoform X2 n=1 Tax=Eucyclogobius newberryi TaxID=166745 RepID=UPI003B5C8FA3
MDTDGCNGQSFASGGDSSIERDFSEGLGGPAVSTPNSKETSPSRSHSAKSNSIKVELYSDEEQGRFTEDERGERVEEGVVEPGPEAVGTYRELGNTDIVPTGAIRLPNGKLKCNICGMICIGPNVLMVHKRSHTGERPFQCNQCGASFTQKGNLLRHIKLHSGEKPFKCPFCSYACRRRDALTGHLRTHAGWKNKTSSPSVGKPYKCNYCGRSYKQQSALEEHHERCHSYLQSVDPQQAAKALNQGEDVKDLEIISDSLLRPSLDKMSFIDRLANSITKRKRSTPQKFLGQKQIRLNFTDIPYELNAGLDKEGERHTVELEAPHFTVVGGEYTGGTGRPLHLSSNHQLTELRPIHSTAPLALGPRLDCTGLGAVVEAGREAGEGHEDLPAARSHVPSPCNGCQDSTDTESTLDEPCNSTASAAQNHNVHHLVQFNHNQLSNPVKLIHTKEEDREDAGHVTQVATHVPTSSSPTTPSSTSRETFRVVDGEGRAVKSFRCDHCRMLFLDHVMFTIHMGCHGFRQPFECNICGHRSQDRYEFTSHIVRGEHIVDG